MTKPKAYKMLRDSEVDTSVKAGDTVYEYFGCDYGCADDDTRILGIEHESFTKNPNGGTPFFTAPIRDVEEIKS